MQLKLKSLVPFGGRTLAPEKLCPWPGRHFPPLNESLLKQVRDSGEWPFPVVVWMKVSQNGNMPVIFGATLIPVAQALGVEVPVMVIPAGYDHWLRFTFEDLVKYEWYYYEGGASLSYIDGMMENIIQDFNNEHDPVWIAGELARLRDSEKGLLAGILRQEEDLEKYPGNPAYEDYLQILKRNLEIVRDAIKRREGRGEI